MTIENAVYLLGISAVYRGHQCLVVGIELALEHPEILFAATRELYPSIASRVGSTPKRVERNLRTVIDVCWNRGNRRFLDKIAGYQLVSPPPPTEMIDLVAAYLQRINSKTTV